MTPAHVLPLVDTGGNARSPVALLRRLLRDRSAGAAMEFALIVPVLLTLVLGIVEVAMAMFASSLLEGSVREAARYGITGYTLTGQSRETVIFNIVKRYSAGMFNMSKVKITYLTYKSFTNIGQPEPFNDANHNGKYDVGETFTDVNGNGKWDADMGAASTGGPGDVVVYTVAYDWPLMTGYLSGLLGLKIPLRASYAVRNEPWGTP